METHSISCEKTVTADRAAEGRKLSGALAVPNAGTLWAQRGRTKRGTRDPAARLVKASQVAGNHEERVYIGDILTPGFRVRLTADPRRERKR